MIPDRLCFDNFIGAHRLDQTKLRLVLPHYSVTASARDTGAVLSKSEQGKYGSVSVSPPDGQILFAVSYINREGLKFFKIHSFFDLNVVDCYDHLLGILILFIYVLTLCLS